MTERQLCACGCGQDVPPGTRGEQRRFSSAACKQRAYRNGKKKTVTEVTHEEIKPILKYPGAKWSRAKWIISHFPAHDTYLEPYCGSAAVFFTKEPARLEVLGDLDGNIINLLSVLRRRGPELAAMIDLTLWAEAEYEFCEKHLADTDDELEYARRFLVRCWQAHGTQLGKKTNSWRHQGINGRASTTALWKQVPERLLAAAHRLKDAEIRNRPALELIDYYNAEDCLIYADPPYVKHTRKSVEHYQFEMTDGVHIQMLEALARHKGAAVLSGYDSDLYDQHLPDWSKAYMPTVAEHGNIHMEVLWLNPRAAGTQQMRLFGEEAV